MKINQKINYKKISKKLTLFLNIERKKRKFNTKNYINKKAKKLNEYMKNCNLDCCVIAVSGGLDSSVTLGIVKKAQLKYNSPIKRIEAISIPCNTDGATNQDIAYLKAKNVANHFDIKIKKIEISNPVMNFTKSIEKQIGLNSDPWSRGQAVSYFRTSSIYYTTSLLTNNGFKSIVIGTTNRDEGAYIGYFGKASDGMVDVQLISDIHKYELKKIAKYLDIPNQIINDSPTGDMYDGRLDEEVFGTPYDFVEFYTYYLEKSKNEKKILINKMKKNNCFEEFQLMAINIENMHRYNGHKYLGSSPAVHLDIIPALFKGGWKYNVYKRNKKECKSPTVGNHTSW